MGFRFKTALAALLWAAPLALGAQPMPPDTTAPTRGTESPAPGATSVPVGTQVVFCVYDGETGVDAATLQVVLDDGGGPVPYSATQNAANFATSANDAACVAGLDGANPNGRKVTVTPLTNLPASTTVNVTPSFSDVAGNPYAGGSYSFQTDSGGGPPPPPDTSGPNLANHSPAPGATGVSVTTQIVFCAYDAGAGVDLSSVSVVVDDGTARTYSATQNAANFAASVNDAACTSGTDGANPRGVRVTVTPVAALPYSTTVTVTPALADALANAYTGGAYTFQTQASADASAPTRGTESPAPGATAVPVGTTIALCAYDVGSGVNVSSISVVVNDGTAVTYSAVQNAANFAASINDAACTGGTDGANAQGVKVTVSPLSALPNSTLVSVTPSFSDNAANAYAGGSYSFTTEDSPPPPPDSTPPTVANQSPFPGATEVATTTTIVYCAYDSGSGVDVASISVVVNDGTSRTYSSTQNAANFATSVNDAACTSGIDGANARGVRVIVTPLTALAYSTNVIVTPSFVDLSVNAYAGGGWSFTTAALPDSTAPTVADRDPAAGATSVPIGTPIAFCAYDVGSGVDVASLQVVVDDGSARTYSATQNAANFAASVNDAACTGGGDGANPRGVRVTVTPLSTLPESTIVLVTPSFADQASNPYAGGGWSFTTGGGPPPPPDLTAPFRATETPAPGATWVAVGSTVVFCAYDDDSGVDVSSLSVQLADTATSRTYSATVNAANFAASVDDPACTGGIDGANLRGVKVTVTPVTAFPNDVDVAVTSSFADQQGNPYAGGPYTFHTEPAVDNTPPWRDDEAPAPNSVGVALNTTIAFCAYDAGWGVDPATLTVQVDDGSPTTYSAAATPGNFAVTPNHPGCTTAGNGADTFGLRVVVTPLANLAADTDVLVTTTFSDQATNTFGPDSYLFHTEVIIDPFVLFQDPAGNTIVGGLSLIRIYVYYPDGLAAGPVQISFDNQWTAARRITLSTETVIYGYEIDPSRGIYDLLWNTASGMVADDGVSLIGAMGNNYDGPVTVYARGLGADGRQATLSRNLTVANIGGQPKGSGTLLRREAGDSMCRSCHDVQGHSAGDTDTDYGNWGFGCWDCHTAHGSNNVMLVRREINTPNSGVRQIDLRTQGVGEADYGLVELADPPGSNGLQPGAGICETCHTKTRNGDGTPRFRNTGEGGGTHPTGNCSSCHNHKDGFKGGGACNGCHNAPPLTASVGNVHGVHDGSGVVPDTYGQVASASTATYYSFPCGKCHPSATGEHLNATGAGTSGDPKVVQVAGHFDSTAAPFADISPSVDPIFTPGASTYVEQGPGGEYFRYTNGTCANVYCHGEFPGGNLANDPIFQTGTQACGACHGASAGAPPSGGSHAVHAGGLALVCATCHEGTVDGGGVVIDRSIHVNGSADWNLLRTDARLGALAVYSGSDVGAKGPPSASYGTCASVYCHSNGAPVTGTQVSQTPTWGGAIAGACLGCHGGDAASAQPIGSSPTLAGSATHTKHLAAGYACDDCHDDTVQDRTSNTVLAAGAAHVNAVKNVKFTSHPVNQSSGTWSSAGHTCSGLYCHSSGTSTVSFGAPLVTPDWDNPASGCATCHDGADANATALSGSHFEHTETDGYAMACQRCHGQTVSGSSTIADPALHVNGVKDLFLSGAPNQAAGTGTLGATCASIYCHSAGSDFTAPYADARSATWGSAGSCNLCHGSAGTGGAPSYATGSPKANSHGSHAFAACSTCHASVVDASKNILDKSLHVNGSYQVQSAQFTLANAPSATTAAQCNSIACHGGGNATWGATLGCLSCHGGAEGGALSDGTPNGVGAEWATGGHGSAAGGALSSTKNGCDYCHQHDADHTPTAGTNPYRLRFSATTNALCLECHGSAGSGISADSAGGALALEDGANVDAAHWGGKHGGADGGRLCWDCHDPHGVPANILMVKSQVSKTSDGTYGIPAVTVPVTFTARAAAGDFVKSNGNPRQGICQACHDNTLYWQSDGTGSNHNETATCTGCHQHQNDFSGAGGSCDACHSAPPTIFSNIHQKHDASGLPTAYGEVASVSTTTTYGFPCGKCHSGTHMNDASTPKVVEVVFDSTAEPRAQVAGMAAPTYTPGTVFSEVGPGGESFRYTAGTCGNLYCHGEFPGGNLTNNPVFNGTQACGTCHGASSGAPPAGGSHTAHVAGSVALTCNACHESTANATPAVIDKTRHVDGAAEWNLLRTDARLGAAATYGGTETGTKRPPSATYQSCSVYCHTNGAPITGPTTPFTVAQTPTWGGAIGGNCTGCHGGDAASGQPIGQSVTLKGSTTHVKHVSGYGYACDDCHNATMQDRTSNTVLASGQTTHTNAAKNVGFSTFPVSQTGGTWSAASHQCSGTYCHSNGQNAVSPFGAPLVTADWDNPSSGCATCHDQATATTTGLSGAHAKHVETDTYAMACERCHGTTVTGSTTIASVTLHVNGLKDRFLKGAPNQTDGTGSLGATCSSLYCHSAGNDFTAPYVSAASPTFTAGTGTCTSCHGAPPAYASGSPKANSHPKHAYTCNTCHAGVVNASNQIISFSNHVNGSYQLQASAAQFTLGNAPSATVAAQCNSITCHGNGSATWGGTLKCLDCHSGSEGGLVRDGTANGVAADWASRGHGSAAGGSFGATTSTVDGCDYCHQLDAAHVPTDAANPYRLRFSATDNSLCLRCHATGDPGINVNSAGASLTLKDSALDVDEAHYGSDHTAARNGGKLCWDCHDPHGGPANILMVKSQVSKTSDPYGVPTSTAAVSFLARAAASDFVKTANPRNGICQACHTTTSFWTSAGAGESHNATTTCTNCHEHPNGFGASGGGCMGCHTGSQGTRRGVVADFALQSHHVGNGTATMGGTLTDFDCVVCHAEGTVSAGAVATTALHNDGACTGGKNCINLRSADSTSTSYAYDKDAVAAAAGAVNNWDSRTALWRTEMRDKMDPFCLSCHDAGGATAAYTLGDAGATALNPFNDLRIANEYDQKDRTRVIDIASMVVGSPPPDGQFARHAIRGKSTSANTKYTGLGAGYQSLYEAGVLASTGVTITGEGPLWNDTSVMACADCHTNDGANGAAGNAHGSTSEYLLKAANGTAVEGTYGGSSYVCYRCHPAGNYGTGHTGGNGSDFVDTTGSTGAARLSNGTYTGIACINCHGGAPGNGEPAVKGYGRIHGTSSVFNIYGGGTRNSYRFMNGASLRFYNPGTWASGGTCYTLASGDTWGGCTQHSKTGKGISRQVTRPATY